MIKMRKSLQFEEDISELETGTKLGLDGQKSSAACFGFLQLCLKLCLLNHVFQTDNRVYGV